MYQVDDIIRILDGVNKIEVKIIKINLDGTFEVETEQGNILRIYQDDIIEE